jgi:heat shock protein HslJ
VLVLISSDGAEAVLRQPGKPHPELAGRWIVETVGGEAISTERRPAVLSIRMNSIGIQADCTSFGGAVSISGPASIRLLGPMGGTAIGCNPEDAAEDDLLAKALASMRSYRLIGDRLELSGDPGLVARRPNRLLMALEGNYEVCGNTLRGVHQQGPITLTVRDGTIRDAAGCTAMWSADGSRLMVEKGADPACERAPASVSQRSTVAIGGDVSTLAVAPPDGYAFDPEGDWSCGPRLAF